MARKSRAAAAEKPRHTFPFKGPAASVFVLELGRSMAHDVFISYSSKDKTVADATCATLESRGIRCWMAPRDITPGADWGEAIVDAINGSRAFVLVFSENANASPQIKREVERTINRGIPVIPLRIENVMPAKSLEYFLSTPHWLDAFTPPLEHHLSYLADVIRSVLDGQKAPPAPMPHWRLQDLDRRVLIGGGAVVVLAAAFVIWSSLRILNPPTSVGKWVSAKIETDTDTANPYSAFTLAAFAKAPTDAQKLVGNFEVNDLGRYKADFGGDDSGTMRLNGPGKATFTSDISHRSIEVSYLSVTGANAVGAVQALGGQSGESLIALTATGMQQSTLIGTPAGPGLAGHWYIHSPANPMLGAATNTLDITGDGHYRYHFSIAESGVWQAADGKWTRSPQGMTPVSGTYKFSGSSEVTCVATNGTTVWKRAE